MRLTSFSHAALCVIGGMMLSLFIGSWGRDVYAGVVIGLLALVFVAEWRAPKPVYSHEVKDAR